MAHFFSVTIFFLSFRIFFCHNCFVKILTNVALWADLVIESPFRLWVCECVCGSYYLHRSRDSLSPVCGNFLSCCHVRLCVCVCVSVCLSICAIAEHPLPGELKKIWLKALSLIFTYVEYIYFSFLNFFLLFWHFWSHPSVDHPTVDNGGIRRGGSVDVAVFISDKWHITCDTWHGTCDTWHATCAIFIKKNLITKNGYKVGKSAKKFQQEKIS